MNESTPQMGSGGFKAQGTASSGGSTPTATPPSGAIIASAKSECGCDGGASGGISAEAPPPPMGMSDTAPSVRPNEGVSAGITAWQNNKRITGLWSINQDRNSWVHVDGIGWKRLANNSASAIVALTILGSHAREKASVVNYREENDGMIREMYVW